MTALTAPRATLQMGSVAVPKIVNVPIKASTKIYAGSLVVIDAGYAAPGRSATGLIPAGRARRTVDNSSGATGALNCEIERGEFSWNNSAAADAIAQANAGQDCYIVDDNTVALTDGNGARSLAGKIIGLAADGTVVVEMFSLPVTSQDAPVRAIISLTMDLASIATGTAIAAFTPGFAGRILKTAFVTARPATTASKLATLQPRISTTNVTGGALALTSANQTPQGTVLAGTAVTAANTFSATDTIDIQASSVTTFVEGSGTLQIYLG